MRAVDRVAGVLLLALAAGYYYASGDVEIGFASDRVGPRAFPRGLAVVLAIASLMLIGRTFLPRYRVAEPVRAEVERMGRLWLWLGMTAVYLWLLPAVGYLLLTPVYLAAFAVMLGYRRFVPVLGTAVALTVILHTVFARMLRVRLPAGLLEG